MPFDDHRFDIVFSKDSFVHIADKECLFDEVFRVLAPGGMCVFGDWCCGPPPYSPEMLAFLQNGMDFSMATKDDYTRHLNRAGFVDINLRDRNSWFTDHAERQYLDAIGPKQNDIVRAIGREAAERTMAANKRRAIIARQGHLRPTHFRATKP